MVLPEIDSFVFKFKNLLHLEKDATLTLKSEAGKASVTLSVELVHVLSDSLLRNPRNGPARQRRGERRAAARVAEKESSKQEVVKKVDTVEKDTLTEEVEDQTTTANVHETEKESNDAEKVVDHPTAGATSNASTNRLIMKLDKKETVPVVMGLPSSIVQLSGEGEEELVKYSFESTYHEDDIHELLSEILNLRSTLLLLWPDLAPALLHQPGLNLATATTHQLCMDLPLATLHQLWHLQHHTRKTLFQ